MTEPNYVFLVGKMVATARYRRYDAATRKAAQSFVVTQFGDTGAMTVEAEGLEMHSPSRYDQLQFVKGGPKEFNDLFYKIMGAAED